MIVIVGNPGRARATRQSAPADVRGRDGRAARGSTVEIVGRAGEDPDGDALMLALARAGIGHVAVLRDPAHATAMVDEYAGRRRARGGRRLETSVTIRPDQARAGLPRGRPPPGRLSSPRTSRWGCTTSRRTASWSSRTTRRRRSAPSAIEAATFAGAHLVLLVPPTVAPADLPEAGRSVTVLAAPAEHDEGAFARLVGSYAAALDAGSDPSAAFSLAVSAVGWEVELSACSATGAGTQPHGGHRRGRYSSRAAPRPARSPCAAISSGPLLRTLFTGGGPRRRPGRRVARLQEAAARRLPASGRASLPTTRHDDRHPVVDRPHERVRARRHDRERPVPDPRLGVLAPRPQARDHERPLVRIVDPHRLPLRAVAQPLVEPVHRHQAPAPPERSRKSGLVATDSARALNERDAIRGSSAQPGIRPQR